MLRNLAHLVAHVALVGYSPDVCTVADYYFTYLRNSTTQEFMIHGLWPQKCEECTDCGYPSCCNGNEYTYPNDPEDFIGQQWFDGTTTDVCEDEPASEPVILFEHEYLKHASCINPALNTTEFLNLVIDLHDAYYVNYVKDSGMCDGQDEVWLQLDAQYDYVATICG